MMLWCRIGFRFKNNNKNSKAKTALCINFGNKSANMRTPEYLELEMVDENHSNRLHES